MFMLQSLQNSMEARPNSLKPVFIPVFGMTFRLPALAPIAFTLIFFLAACGSQNSTPPPIIVIFTPGFTPPATMSHQSPGNTAGIAAPITNGPQNSNTVGWTVTCGSEPLCGSFDPPSTPSTIPTTYTAPASIPAGNTVTVTATYGGDSTKSVSATITIN
jgi:hypothetical protein